MAGHALYLVLALAKRGRLYDRETRKGDWNVRFEVPAYDLAGRKVRVLGSGVTEESLYCMGNCAAQNVVDCFDGKPNPEYVVNKEVLG